MLSFDNVGVPLAMPIRTYLGRSPKKKKLGPSRFYEDFKELLLCSSILEKIWLHQNRSFVKQLCAAFFLLEIMPSARKV